MSQTSYPAMSASTIPAETRLEHLLDHLVDRGRVWILRSRFRDAVNGSLRPASCAFLGAGVVAVLLVAGSTWLGWERPHWGVLAAVLFIAPLLPLLLEIWRLRRYFPSREEALAIYDERLDLSDRLRTADGFLKQPEPGSFALAAIADALPAAQAAADKELYWQWGVAPEKGSNLWLVALGFLCFILAFFWPDTPWDGGAIGTGDQNSEPAALVNPPEGDPMEEEPETVEPEPENENVPEKKSMTKAPLAANPSSAEQRERIDTPRDDQVKETEGISEGGQQSDAKSSGRSSRSQGTPGSQSPAAKPSPPRDPKKKEPKKTAKKDADLQAPKKQVKDRSGATSGRGSSSGSSRNPASTDWSSKDRVEESEDQELEQEEDVDDEESESEARGGLQPNLRDRRPPVNRDLSIGFGNRSNPDANGRGGPGQRKKSRGVASLVLGVPVPDHVKGQANPGRVKITQERIQPKAEKAEDLAAEERTGLQAPYGEHSRRQLSPEMKRLVQRFFSREDDTQSADESAGGASEPAVIEIDG